MELPVTETTAPPKLETIHSAGEIQQLIPHRWPVLMVDRIVEYDPEAKRIVGIKGVAATEWYFQGHFPGLPVMPGVLQVEALAQTMAVYVAKQPGFGDRIGLFAGIDDCRFKRIVSPGDTLTLECEIDQVRGPVGRGKASARVDGELAARGTLTFAVER
jgi:3-hydroxyacyl-[acyl-carrier-protein] dehydratase